MRLTFIFKAAILLALTGCASQSVLIGNSPKEPAPQVVFLGARDAKGLDYLTWENVSSFGRVPSELQAKGDVSCMRLGSEMRAVGYHPRAKDRYGKVMPGGGFFCQVSLNSALSQESPRLQTIDGQVAWDRPGLFRPIPNDLMPKAISECQKHNKQMKPLGYHPNPLDMNGVKIVGGGFLCAD